MLPFLALIVLILVIGFVLRRRFFAVILRLPTMPSNQVQITRGVAVLMADGITLTHDHYTPLGVDDAPTVLIRTPYGRNLRGSLYGGLLAFFCQRFAERGYHVMIQDVRGRFDSDGEFFPYIHEQADGLATVAWMREQAWFNGQIATWGPSYLGIVQWVIAHEVPEIQAMMPIVTASSLYNIMYPNGALNYGLLMRWLSIFHLLDTVHQQSYWAGMRLLPKIPNKMRQVNRHLPLAEADKVMIGADLPVYQRAMLDTHPDTELWQHVTRNINVAGVRAAVHLIGGWFDFFLTEQLNDYQTLKGTNNPAYLTVGTWQHFGNLNGLLTGIREGVIWFDYHLKGQGELRPQPVKLFKIGANTWHDYDDYPVPSKPHTYYLTQERLQTNMPTAAESNCYRYDPYRPTPAIGGAQFSFDISPRKDNRRLAARADVLSFTSDILPADFDIMGAVRLVLYVQSTCDTTDFFGRLCDVAPNGRSLNVTDGLFRITTNADSLQKIEIQLHATAYRFRAGHRLQVLVASGAHPRWLRNHGTDEPFTTATIMLPADQTVYCGADKLSQLILPIVE